MSTPVVVAVTPNSPADRAGVVSGDLILSINGAVPR
ncbi:MAG: PDZ domain-containing protein, partial [Acidimicrobiales bacterium]|nr:PDZ domain-containing protein [Acidimicrobiales bacterium]